MVNTEIPLGIIPAGTGNDFARSLGIPLHDIRASLHLLIGNSSRSVDIGKINDTYFLNVASVGFDAEIVRDFQKIK